MPLKKRKKKGLAGAMTEKRSERSKPENRQRDKSPQQIIMLKGDPSTIDEITGQPHSIHIERMTSHRYFVRIGDNCFTFLSADDKGPGIRMRIDQIQDADTVVTHDGVQINIKDKAA